MKYRDLWQRLLPIYEEGEAKAIVRLVLEDRFGLTLADVLSGGIFPRGEGREEREERMWKEEDGRGKEADEAEELERLMCRLEKGEPVQYVLGEAWFRGRRFHVEKGVLIPRPETEELVEWVVESWKEEVGGRKSDAGETRMLDIGTGSGCIAISLALDLPGTAVTAWEISSCALRVARENAERLGADVMFTNQDTLWPPSDDEAVWDVIVSNPPYISLSEADMVDRNVRNNEPCLALFVPDDSLLYYRAIAQYACRALKPGGGLYFEVSSLHADEVLDLLHAMGFADAELRLDQFGKKRMVKGVKNEE